MRISRIRMQNFRCFKDTIIDFKNSSFVLLTAPNGCGKTSVIDAIEWVLTGNIKRLQQPYKFRSTNKIERNKNNKGIIKYKQADDNEEVIVTIWIQKENNTIELCRKQKKDQLDYKDAIFTLDGDTKAAEKFTKDINGESFYNFHFCDIHKAFNLQNLKENDLSEMFDDFITNYDYPIKVADNLHVFVNDTERYIEDKRTTQDKLKKELDVLSQQIEELRGKVEITEYPQVIFFQGEELNISNLSKDDMEEAYKRLRNFGYIVAKNHIQKIIENTRLCKEESIINQIISEYQKSETEINKAFELGFYQNDDVINTLRNKKTDLNELEISKGNIKRVAPQIIDLNNLMFTNEYFNQSIGLIDERETVKQELDSDIEQLSKNNRLLKLMADLVAEKDLLIQSRNKEKEEKGIVRCPVCGSESYSNLNDIMVLREAENYIDENNKKVLEKTRESNKINDEIKEAYNILISAANSVIEGEKKKLDAKIKELEDIKEKSSECIKDVKKLVVLDNRINMEIFHIEKIYSLLSEIKRDKLSEKALRDAESTYDSILKVLGYERGDVTVDQMLERVNGFIEGEDEVIDFSLGVYISKINSLECNINNEKLIEKKETFAKVKKEDESLEKEINNLIELKRKAEERAEQIENMVIDLKQEEYKNIGPVLEKYYKKLSRVDTVGKVEVNQDDKGVMLLDEKGKNVVNILSSGQISVFMLAYFFAGINARNDNEDFKVYFMDDLTACMDDINILTFLDMVKYQMESKKEIEQLFFVTCNEKIRKLVLYKLQGKQIEVREIVEKHFQEN